jgi:hypothetical protein
MPRQFANFNRAVVFVYACVGTSFVGLKIGHVA